VKSLTPLESRLVFDLVLRSIVLLEGGWVTEQFFRVQSELALARQLRD